MSQSRIAKGLCQGICQPRNKKGTAQCFAEGCRKALTGAPRRSPESLYREQTHHYPRAHSGWGGAGAYSPQYRFRMLASMIVRLRFAFFYEAGSVVKPELPMDGNSDCENNIEWGGVG